MALAGALVVRQFRSAGISPSCPGMPRCLAWEQVGFGGSLREGLRRDLSMPAQAEYLTAWLRQLDHVLGDNHPVRCR